MQAPVILVVDDEALLRLLAADHFEDAGFEVIEAANGAEALQRLRERPDVKAVFTDVHMPGAPDGIMLARRVRDMSPDCAIVVVSGRAAPAPGELAVGARFVSKPYMGETVVRMIRDMIGAEGA